MSELFELLKTDPRVREVAIWFDMPRRRVQVRIRRTLEGVYRWGIVYPSGTSRVFESVDVFPQPDDALENIMAIMQTDGFWVDLREGTGL